MKYRRLGNSDIEVSEISLGCWTLGGISWVNGVANGWSNVDEDDITRAVKRALDAGVNHFDNADVYGNGEAERMLARVLKRLGVASNKVIIASKVGHFPGTAAHAYEPSHIRHQCEQSLLNLQREYVDIYYLHHDNFGQDDHYLEPAAATLNELVKAGKIRLKGQSGYTQKGFKKSVPIVQPTVLQSWAHAMAPQFIQPGNPVPNLLAKHNMSFVAFSPLNQGILLDKYDPNNPPTFAPGDHRAKSKKFTHAALAAVQPKLIKIKERFGASAEALAGVALRYVLNHPHVACVIPGFRNEQQVACNLNAAHVELDRKAMNFVYQTLK